MKYAVDTGALLSLASSDYFSSIVTEYSLVTTEAVQKELAQFAEYGDFLGRCAQKVDKEIKNESIKKEESKSLLALKLGSAEVSIFSLGKEKKYTILTDDMHAARVAQQELQIYSKPSFSLLLQLYKKKKITKQQLLIDFDKITRQRNWMTGVLYEYVKSTIEKLE